MVWWRLMLKKWHPTIKYGMGVNNDGIYTLSWLDIMHKLSNVINWWNPFQNYHIVTERWRKQYKIYAWLCARWCLNVILSVMVSMMNIYILWLLKRNPKTLFSEIKKQNALIFRSHNIYRLLFPLVLNVHSFYGWQLLIFWSFLDLCWPWQTMSTSTHQPTT